MEFFFLVLIIFFPGETAPMFQTVPFGSHSDCSSALQDLDTALHAEAPPGIDIRLSCVSSESIGQNGV